MKVGVGYCDSANALLSGRVVARNAIRNGNIQDPHLVLAFCSGRLDHDRFRDGLRSIVGHQAPIVGGSAIGIITNHHLSYDGYAAGAAVIESESLRYEVASVGDLDKDELVAGQRLAEKLSNKIKAKLLLLFYDSVKMSPNESRPPIMNASPPLIKGFRHAFASSIPIIGAGLVGDYDFSATKQFCGTHVDNQTVVGTLLGGDIHLDWAIMHGCTPMDGVYHSISKVEGSIIYEIDGKPAACMIDAIYGNQDWRRQTPVRRLAIGVNLGERFGTYKENEYVNRLITGVLPEGDGIMIFEPDLANGTDIQFMLRDSNKIIESARRNAQELVQSVESSGKTPVFGFYIDCAGRTASHSDTRTEEATEVSQALTDRNIPMLGFYSGVEIAPVLGNSQGLDWTGVLLIFSGGQKYV